ncbi:MAG: DUF6576 domain-containing protein [Acidimicrobiales bacterium]
MARFSFPSPGHRSNDDAWFRLGNLDVTSTVLVVGTAALSMVLWAVSPSLVDQLWLDPDRVLNGQLWRIVTWPVAERPDLFAVIGLFFFYMIGRELERLLGRDRFMYFVGLITVVPAVVAVALNIAAAGMSDISLPCFVGLAIIYPQARSFFNIPLWVIAAVFVGIRVLELVGNRYAEGLIFLAVSLATGLLALKAFGLLENVTWVPKMNLPKRTKAPRPKSKGRGRGRGKANLKAVPNSEPAAYRPPPNRPGDGLRQAEVDVLLDKIAEHGIGSLTPEERRRLDEASKRLREEKG